MSSILSSQGMVLATAMAVSGTVVLLVLRLQKSPPPFFSRISLPQSSIISSDHVKAKEKKRKKRVQFAEDVVDPTGNSEDYRKLRSNNNNSWGAADSSSENIKNRNLSCAALKKGGRVVQEMPANRVALYNGILRDRVHKMRSSSY
ncbi:uncharacterized protein LOC142505960 [Primulina tabacum]|uniref:uncharacterized protein LOC142505960 n=1 Tax=Primulina tabacum TaxID=48773 RepID=UPI003F598DAC